MKRRRFFQAIASAPVASAALAQSPGGRPATGAAAPVAQLISSVSDGAASPVTGFFAPEQFAALRKLGEVIMPAMDGKPGALEAEAAEFLDFLIGKSPQDRQHVYGAGLNALNAASRARYGKPFGELETAQANPLLEPLRQPWTYHPPGDPLEHFLREAKADIRTATMNSKPYVEAAASSGRRFGGRGSYMLPMD